VQHKHLRVYTSSPSYRRILQVHITQPLNLPTSRYPPTPQGCSAEPALAGSAHRQCSIRVVSHQKVQVPIVLHTIERVVVQEPRPCLIQGPGRCGCRGAACYRAGA
jgi:hypothetical protein